MSSSVPPRLFLRTACSDTLAISPTQYITTVASISFASGRPNAVIEGPISSVSLCETKCLTTISEGTKAASIAGWEYLQEGSCGGGPMRRSQPLSLVQGYGGAASQGWNLEARRVGGARCIFPNIKTKDSRRRCLNGGPVSLDSPMCGRSHRLQGAALPSIVRFLPVQIDQHLMKAANPQISKSIGIGWLSRTACQFKNGTSKRLQNGHSITRRSLRTSNGSSRSSQRRWIRRC